MANSDLVQALCRGLDILTAVGAADDGLRLGEVAGQLGLKPSTAHNLVRTLVARGYLRRDPDGRLRVGPAVGRLHEQQADRLLLHQAAAAMQDLALRFPRMTLTFAEIAGSEVAFSLRMSPDRPCVLQRPAGQTFHPYANASGLACLAFATAEQVRPVRERFGFYEFGAHLWGTPERFAAALAEMRQAGVAALPFEGQETFRFAAPVFTGDGLFVGALGSSNRLEDAADEARRRDLVAAVRQRAEEIR